jgi:hypothetical protein
LNKLGNDLAGLEDAPPIRGLPNSWVKIEESMDEMYYPMMEPIGHARPKIGNAIA